MAIYSKFPGDEEVEIVTDMRNGLMSHFDKLKLDGIEAGATNYEHPITHPYSMITGAPTSMLANGGNADTVGGKSVSELATVSQVNEMKNSIGIEEKITKQLFGILIASSTSVFTDCGQGLLRVFCSWKIIETSKGVFDWTRLDKYVSYAYNNGLEILYILGTPPNWATTPSNYGIWDANPYTPNNDQDTIDFLTALTVRYGDKIKYYECWNEADSKDYTYPSYKGTMAQLAHFMQVVFTTMRVLSPNAKILSPSFSCSPNLLGQFLDAGGTGYFDILAIHLYVDPQPPESMIKKAREYKNILRVRGIDCPIWNTETGYGSYIYNGTTYPDGWTGGNVTVMPNSMAIDYISRFYLCSLFNGFSCAIYYMADSIQNTLRLFDPVTFVKTEVGLTVQKLSNFLVGATILDRYYMNNAYIIAVRKDKLDYIIAWSTDGESAHISIPNESTINYAEDMVGNLTYPYNNKIGVSSSPIILHIAKNNTYQATSIEVLSAIDTANNLIQNGNFKFDSSNWNLANAGSSIWSFANSMLQVTCNGDNKIDQFVSVNPNTRYTLSFNVDTSHNYITSSFISYAQFTKGYGFITGAFNISGNTVTFTTSPTCKFINIIICTGGLSSGETITITNISIVQTPDINAISSELYDIQNYTPILAVSNVYTLDLLNKQIANFSITTLSSVATSIVFSNIIATVGKKVSVEVFLTYSNTSSIIFPTVIWKDGIVPVFAIGKRYKLFFETYDNGITWLASYTGAW